jgi:hypothetical protein
MRFADTRVGRGTYIPSMIKHPVTRARQAGETDHRIRPGHGAAALGALEVAPVVPRRVEHRDGAGHLEPAYEAQLRLDVRARRVVGERAFVGRASSAGSLAEQSGEEFVMAVTSGGATDELALYDEATEERGGPFIVTNSSLEFAYGTDESNPLGATREPFPRS